MLNYLAAPYTSVVDKDELMKKIMTFIGKYHLANSEDQIVSPLLNHFSLPHVPGLGSDWEFWKNYSENLIKRCDKIIVLNIPGWRESVGVQAEIELATTNGLYFEVVDLNMYMS